MARLVLLVLPALLISGVVFYVSVAAPYLLTYQPHPSPDQPIRFDHQLHVERVGLDCAFCHRTAEKSVTAGMPDVEQCMFCHQTIGAGQPEIEKVRQAWLHQQPIDWVRVHRMPDHVQFPHEAHEQAGVACATCHGPVEQMGLAEQVRPLNMRDCVECHKQQSAPNQCGVCHY